MCRHTKNYKTHFELPVNKTKQLIRPNQNCFQELSRCKRQNCPLRMSFFSKLCICHIYPFGQRPTQTSKVKGKTKQKTETHLR